jgi:uncharacterized membrane protein
MSKVLKSEFQLAVEGRRFLITYPLRYTKQTISDLLQNKVDMSQLVITKALAKSGRASNDLRQISLLMLLKIMRLSKHMSNWPSG